MSEIILAMIVYIHSEGGYLGPEERHIYKESIASFESRELCEKSIPKLIELKRPNTTYLCVKSIK